MKRLNSSTVFMIAILLLIGALAMGSLVSFNRMNQEYILVQSEMKPVKLILNNYGYLQGKRGFIFSITFLVIGISFVIMIALPSEDAKIVKKKTTAPQPVGDERKESSISAIIEKSPSDEKRAAPPVSPPSKSEKEEPLIISPIEIIPQVEELSAEIEDVTEGEDDVVYGSGPVSDAAIIHFVHKFSDSAIKFLFRKQLDGKALTSVEEGIYQEWDDRQLTRGKVKGYILTLMDWKEFPKKPLYEVWKQIRDHIYENVE
ncbi:hypothetical protein KKA14_12065 [bacterium]|nr:hypothetical protein [bacterium]